MKNILAILSLMLLIGCGSVDTSSTKRSLQEKVLKKGVIRAAYTIYYPGCFKDSTGKLKGVFVETLEKAAKDLDLKVEWVEEVGWATQIEGLNNDKYDMMGSSVWANPKRAKNATLSIPLYYSPLYVYTRANETKFDNIKNYEDLNSPRHIFSLVDGGTGEVIYKNMFSNAGKISLPQNTDFGTSFLDVKGKKADLVIMEPYQANKFSQNNPNVIKSILPKTPIKVFGNCYMFKKNEIEFQNMLNVVLTDLNNSGFIDKLLLKYEGVPNNFMRASKPFDTK